MKKSFVALMRWLPSLMMMTAIFYFSSQPSDQLPNFSNWDYAIKKLGHWIGYGILALSFFHGLKYNEKYLWLAWLLAVIFSASDEFHQSFVAGRHASIFDVVVFDNLGAAFALWLYAAHISKVAKLRDEDKKQ